MRMVLCPLVVTLVFIVFIVLLVVYNREQFLEYRVSPVNKRRYGIQEMLTDAHLATDKLATLHERMFAYVATMRVNHPADARVWRLSEGISRVAIEESPDEPDTSSYTINKGDLMGICLRPKKSPDGIGAKFHDDTTMWFVVCHEMAHIMSLSEGHGEEFITNFKFILKTSHDYGLYDNPVDYRIRPIVYCGVKVTNNPMFAR